MIRKNVLYAVLSVFILLNFAGCTVLGFLWGVRMDAEDTVFDPGSTNKLAEIKNNTRLKIKLRNKQVMTGTLQGIKKVDSTLYLQRYNAFQTEQRNKNIFPAINDTITMVKGSGLNTPEDNSQYLFSGFDFMAIRFRSLADSNMSSEKLDSLDYIVDQHGKKFNPQRFKLYLVTGIVPLQSEFIIQSSGGMEIIPVEKVSKIELPKAISAKVLYTLIGLSMDVLAYLALREFSHLMDGLSGLGTITFM